MDNKSAVWSCTHREWRICCSQSSAEHIKSSGPTKCSIVTKSRKLRLFSISCRNLASADSAAFLHAREEKKRTSYVGEKEMPAAIKCCLGRKAENNNLRWLPFGPGFGIQRDGNYFARRVIFLRTTSSPKKYHNRLVDVGGGEGGGSLSYGVIKDWMEL